MDTLRRQSAVQFAAEAQKEEVREHWNVVLQYRNEGEGPWLVDLSHKSRLDLQDKNIDERKVGGVGIPVNPGESIYRDGLLINRLNGTQASIYALAGERSRVETDGSYTDVSEATVFLALLGNHVFSVAEKLSALDFLAPGKKPPFLYQGPFCHVPCQIVTLRKEVDGSGGFLLTCSRGYARSMVEAILHAGEEFGIRPAGEEQFDTWLQKLSSQSS